MSKDPNCLQANLEKILEVVSIDSERKKLESQLDSITRSPGTKLDSYVHMLYTLYNSAVSLEHLVDDSIEDKDLDQFLDEQMNTEQVSKHHRIV